MRRMKRLKIEALSACRFRGHSMSKFDTLAVGLGPDDPVWARSHCIRCDMYVDVKTEPRPNEIDIGGTAVALNCKEVA